MRLKFFDSIVKTIIISTVRFQIAVDGCVSQFDDTNLKLMRGYEMINLIPPFLQVQKDSRIQGTEEDYKVLLNCMFILYDSLL